MASIQLNTNDLYSVLRSFYILTNIRIVIFDTEFTELLAYPPDRVSFCAAVRQSSTGELSCQLSDKRGCLECAKTQKLVAYRCHAGLTEAVMPINDKNGTLAYVMFGQVLPREYETATKKKIKKRYPALSAMVDQLPTKTEGELDAAAIVLQAITSYVMTNRWVIPEKSEFIRQIDQYIFDHLSQHIIVDDLCVALNIGRTRLYAICKEYLGCGPADYIRKRRIFHAQELLQKTSLPITDITYAVGFSDYSHFFRMFKQITGVSPRHYRQKDG